MKVCCPLYLRLGGPQVPPVFFTLWLLVLGTGPRSLGITILDMDRLSISADTRHQAEALAQQAGLPEFSLHGCRIRTYPRHSLTPPAMQAAEQEICAALDSTVGQESIQALARVAEQQMRSRGFSQWLTEKRQRWQKWWISVSLL